MKKSKRKTDGQKWLDRCDRIQAKLARSTREWMTRLGLNHWRVDVEYVRGTLPGCSNDEDRQVLGDSTYDWRYLIARIRWNVPAALGYDDARIEECVVHELAHILLAPVHREGNAHPSVLERNVSEITSAILRVHRLGQGWKFPR